MEALREAYWELGSKASLVAMLAFSLVRCGVGFSFSSDYGSELNNTTLHIVYTKFTPYTVARFESEFPSLHLGLPILRCLPL
jgi:hypothetical protein